MPYWRISSNWEFAVDFRQWMLGVNCYSALWKDHKYTVNVFILCFRIGYSRQEGTWPTL